MDGYLFAVVLAALALTRLPSAIRGRNPLVMISAAAIVIAFTLITPFIYVRVSSLLPVPNMVDLIAKLSLFTGLILAGSQVSQAYNAPRIRRLIAGQPGQIVFFIVFSVEVVIFALVHSTHLVADLAGNLENPLVRLYSTLATSYAGFVAAILFPLVGRRLRSQERSTRATSAFLVIGFGLTIVRAALGLVSLLIPAAYYVGQVVSELAASFVALGLATSFFARILRQRQARRQCN